MDRTKQRLFLISETSEEMGNYRHKVAKYLNHNKAKDGGNNPICFTTDIGMCVRINVKQIDGTTIDEMSRRIEMRCSYCALSNDYHEFDIFHPITEINEVCIKQEEEGIFYFCKRHDPVREEGNNVYNYKFLERLERYQPFKHIDIRQT